MSENLRIIFGQIFSMVAPILTFASYQFNTKRSLLFIQTAATLFSGIAYLFLSAGSGFVLNIVCIVRNITYYCQKSGSRFAFPSSLAFAAIMCVLGILSWHSPLSLIIMIALAINTVIMSLGKPQLLRKSIPFTSTMVLVYNIFVFSLGGIINESIAIISSVIGIVRFKKTNKIQRDTQMEP